MTLVLEGIAVVLTVVVGVVDVDTMTGRRRTTMIALNAAILALAITIGILELSADAAARRYCKLLLYQ